MSDETEVFYYPPSSELIVDYISPLVQINDIVFSLPLTLDEFVEQLRTSEVNYTYEFYPEQIVDPGDGYPSTSSYWFRFSDGTYSYEAYSVRVSDRLGDSVVIELYKRNKEAEYSYDIRATTVNVYSDLVKDLSDINVHFAPASGRWCVCQRPPGAVSGRT